MDTTDELRSNSILNLPKAALAGVKNALKAKTLSIWLVASVLAAHFGPFGTYQSDTFVELLITWAVLLGAATITAFVVYELCQVLFAKFPPIVCNAFFVAGSAVSIGSLIHILLIYVFADSSSNRPSHEMLIFYSLLILLSIYVLRFVFFSPTFAHHPTKRIEATALAPASLPPHSRLAKRLDIPQEARIIHITAKGHFVEVQTCSDTYQTRMRFLDAVDELDGTLGVTVHRSHWVHRDAIRGWVPDAKKPYVLLENNSKIPVSKTNLDKVEQFGIPKLSAIA